MIGLDVKVDSFHLLLKHLKIQSIYLRIGAAEQFCLKVNSLEKNQHHAIFVVLNLSDPSELFLNTSIIYVTLLSENNLEIGKGQSTITMGKVMSAGTAFPGMQLIDVIGCEIPIVRRELEKPDIELGSLRVQVRIFDLRITKPCLCTGSSQSTCNTVSFGDESLVSLESSSEEEKEDWDDSSLDNFLHRLKSRSSAVQTISEKQNSTTQTAAKEDKPFREKVLHVRRSVDRDVVAVLAPRNRGIIDPTFFAAPSRRTVQLISRPSSAKSQETKRKLPPHPTRSKSTSYTSRSRPLHPPKVEPRKIIAHNLPWY